MPTVTFTTFSASYLFTKLFAFALGIFALDKRAGAIAIVLFKFVSYFFESFFVIG